MQRIVECMEGRLGRDRKFSFDNKPTPYMISLIFGTVVSLNTVAMVIKFLTYAFVIPTTVMFLLFLYV